MSDLVSLSLLCSLLPFVGGVFGLSLLAVFPKNRAMFNLGLLFLVLAAVMCLGAFGLTVVVAAQPKDFLAALISLALLLLGLVLIPNTSRLVFIGGSHRLWHFWLRYDSSFVPSWTWHLVDSSSFSQMREQILTALRSVESRHADKTLLMALAYHDAAVRQAAAEGLGNVGDRQAMEALLVATRDEDASVRQAAVKGLGKIGDRQTWRALAALRPSDPRMHTPIPEALRNIPDARDSRIVPTLLAALTDPDSGVCLAVAGVLGTFYDAQAVEPLITRLLTDEVIRPTAVQALNQIAPGWIESEAGRTTVPVLLADLHAHAMDSYRQMVVQALGQSKDPAAVDAVLATLTDASRGVRWAAAAALGGEQ